VPHHGRMHREGSYRICFVCSGNICRSPMAEAVLRRMAADAGVGDLIAVDSAGTGEWHIGERADLRTLRALAAAGYDGDSHRARQFEPAWFAGLDLVIALDRGHERTLRSWAATDVDRAKVRLLRSFDPGAATLDGVALDVADPYYDDERAFADVLEQIEAACRGVLSEVGAEIGAAVPR
jgi:protein-tyrosine phosphatase